MFLGIKKCIIKKQGYFFSSFFNFKSSDFLKMGYAFYPNPNLKKYIFLKAIRYTNVKLFLIFKWLIDNLF